MTDYELWKVSNNSILYTKSIFHGGFSLLTESELQIMCENLESNLVIYISSENDAQMISLAFDKSKADSRKEWLLQSDPGLPINSDSRYMSYADFINGELKQYYNDNLTRFIPSVCDGLKPLSRKILYAVKLEAHPLNLGSFCTHASNLTAYIHSESSFESAVRYMTTPHNINWLSNTSNMIESNPLAKIVFNDLDSDLYEYKYSDGMRIEPKTFIPVVCTLLINGTMGIGTGISTSIPSFNPLDISNNLRLMLTDCEPNQMIPWYKGFKGRIEQTGSTTYNTIGICEIIDDDKCIITELPIGREIDLYMNFLNGMTANTNIETNQLIKSVSGTKLPLVVEFFDGKLQELITTDSLYQKLRLVTKISTNNMYAYDPQSKLKKYNSIGDILNEYYHFRLKMYAGRIECRILSLENELNLIDHKIKFVDGILNGRFDFKSNHTQWLIANGFPQLSSKIEEIPSYQYLMGISVYDLTGSFVNKLQDQYEKIKLEYEMYTHTTPKQLWLCELTEFEIAYRKNN